MASWSISKLFSKVSLDEFREAVTALQDSVDRNTNALLYLEIGLYRRNRAGLSHTGVDRDSGMPVTRLSPVHEFRFVSNPRDITPDLWEQADYVEAVLRPIDGPEVSARIEAKGLRSRQLTFSVSPDNPGEAVKGENLRQFKRWFKDDGVNSNRVIYGL
jgi:hypothetical protein